MTVDNYDDDIFIPESHTRSTKQNKETESDIHQTKDQTKIYRSQIHKSLSEKYSVSNNVDVHQYRVFKIDTPVQLL